MGQHPEGSIKDARGLKYIDPCPVKVSCIIERIGGTLEENWGEREREGV